MPTYDYQCKACSAEWEEDQKITEDPVTVCPKCKAAAAKRLISGIGGFELRGGGWASSGYSR